MALGIVGLHDAGQPAVQSDVGLGVCGEHEQVGSIVPPADFLLQREAAPSRVAMCAKGSPMCHHPAAACAVTPHHGLAIGTNLPLQRELRAIDLLGSAVGAMELSRWAWAAHTGERWVLVC